METITANWHIVAVMVSAVVAIAFKLPSGRGVFLALFVLVANAITLAVDHIYFDGSSAVQWHTIAIVKVSAVSCIAVAMASSGAASRWWVLVLWSLSLDFVGNLGMLIDWAFLEGVFFATMYSSIGITTALLEGVAAHGDSGLANYRDVRNGQLGSADRVHSAHNHYDQVWKVHEEHERRLTRLENSHDETLGGLRDMTVKIGDLANAISISNEKRDHLSENVTRVEENQRDQGKRINTIERNQESFRPYIEIMKQINMRMWIILMGVLGVAAMAAYKLV